MSPRMIGLHVLALVAVGAGVWLGLWQYDAWQLRREAERSTLVDAVPRPLDSVMDADDPYPADAIGQPVEVEGRWVPGSTFYVEERPLDDRVGYWAVTPVEVCDTDCGGRPAVLVVRGWTREPTQAPPPPEGEVAVSGWLQPPEASGRQDPDPTDDVLHEMRMADALQQVEQDLYGGYVVARSVTPLAAGGPAGDRAGEAGGVEAGLEPVTPESLPQPETFTALRNLLYALEWWVFAAFAAFIWWRWVRDEVTASRSPREPAEPEVASAP